MQSLLGFLQLLLAVLLLWRGQTKVGMLHVTWHLGRNYSTREHSLRQVLLFSFVVS